MLIRGGVKYEVRTFGTASFFSQRIGIYVGWVDVKGFFDYVSIEKVNPPFQVVNGKTD